MVTNQVNKEIDIVLCLLPKLDEEERELVRKGLGQKETPIPQTPCEKLGHKFKVLDRKKGWFIFPGYTRVFCERCGTVRKNYT